jgi:DNA polymerase epsilon subunit 1
MVELILFCSVLKSIVAKCIEEVSHSGDAISDQLLNSVYRYLCGYGNGYLADPLLHRIVYGFMIKLFWKIISSFRELGSKVIFANLNKIIICTNHYDVQSAKEYIEFILNALSIKSTFAYLQVTILSFVLLSICSFFHI